MCGGKKIKKIGSVSVSGQEPSVCNIVSMSVFTCQNGLLFSCFSSFVGRCTVVFYTCITAAIYAIASSSKKRFYSKSMANMELYLNWQLRQSPAIRLLSGLLPIVFLIFFSKISMASPSLSYI